jgi:hypothetical protein
VVLAQVLFEFPEEVAFEMADVLVTVVVVRASGFAFVDVDLARLGLIEIGFPALEIGSLEDPELAQIGLVLFRTVQTSLADRGKVEAGLLDLAKIDIDLAHFGMLDTELDHCVFVEADLIDLDKVAVHCATADIDRVHFAKGEIVFETAKKEVHE